MNNVHPAAMANRTIEQWYCFIGPLRCPDSLGLVARMTDALDPPRFPRQPAVVQRCWLAVGSQAAENRRHATVAGADTSPADPAIRSRWLVNPSGLSRSGS